jgi:hypothetical protein
LLAVLAGRARWRRIKLGLKLLYLTLKVLDSPLELTRGIIFRGNKR